MKLIFQGLVLILGLGSGEVIWGADTAYTIATFAGSNSVGDGGPATQAVLRQAEGVALDSQGNIYVADAQANRVREVTLDGNIRTIAGTGIPGYSGDGGPATAAQLNSPYGVVVDGLGNVYIADLGNARVRRVTPDGRITTIAAAPLSGPRNLALDSNGTLYISDFYSHKVYRLYPSGALEVMAGTGTPGFSGDTGLATSAQLGYPAALALDPRDGALYIGDTQNHALRKVTGGIINTVAQISSPISAAVAPSGLLMVSDPIAGLIYRLMPAVSGMAQTSLSISAEDIALAPDGSLYAASTGLVRYIRPSGFTTIMAGGGDPAAGDLGDPLAARLNHPSGVATDSMGNVYVADRDNNRIRKISRDGILTTAAGSGVQGDAGDGGPATQAALNRPSAVSVDAVGNLWIADTGNHRVRRVNPQGQIGGIWVGASPSSVVADAGGAVYIADSDAGKIVRVSQGQVTTIADHLNMPAGVALDKSGNLYYASRDASPVNRISRDSLASGTPVIDSVPGVWSTPQRVAVDAQGNVFVADAAREQIIRTDASGRSVAVAGSGGYGFSGDGGLAGLAALGSPTDIAIAADGRIFIADQDNNRIRVLSPGALISIDAVLLPQVLNAASGLASAVAPGMLVAIRNSGLQPGDIPQAEFRFADSPGRFVSIDNQQILLQAPDDVPPSGSFPIEIRRNGQHWLTIPAVAAASAPGLFMAVSNEDGTANASTNPANAGSIVTVYGTGFGSATAVSVTIGGQPAGTIYAGPSYAPGIFQINARVPQSLPSGSFPVVVQAGDAVSQAGVTLLVAGDPRP